MAEDWTTLLLMQSAGNDSLLRDYFVERRRSLVTQAHALAQQRRAVLAEVDFINRRLQPVLQKAIDNPE